MNEKSQPNLPSWKLIRSLLSARQQSTAAGHLALSVVLALLEVFSLTIALSFVYHLLSDAGTKSTLPFSISETSWRTLLLLVIGIFVIKNTAAIWLTHRQLKFMNKLYLELSERLYRRFYSLDWATYSKQNSADAFRKIKNTAFDFVDQVLNNGYLLITDMCICFTMTIVLLWIDYRAVFILLVLGLPIALFYALLKKKVVRKIDRSFRTLTPQANIILSQGIESFVEARIYKKGDHFINRFIDISAVTTSQLASLKVFSMFPARMMETLGIILLAVGVFLAKEFPGGAQSTIMMISLLSLVLYRVIPSLNRAVQSLSQIQAYSYSIGELVENLSVPEAQQLHAQEIEFRESLSLKSINFSYSSSGGNVILNNASAAIRKGDFVLLEGPSGVGKTTLLHIMAGLIESYRGEILIDGATLSEANLNSWQEKLSIVQQAPVILQDTILRNVCFGEDEGAMDHARAERVLDQVGLMDFVRTLPQGLHTSVGEHGQTLSGGQRQRLCLARALYRNPQVLLLDEVTNQLDEESKQKIFALFGELCSQGVTIILSSHDPIVKRYAARVIRLHHGVLVEEVAQRVG